MIELKGLVAVCLPACLATTDLYAAGCDELKKIVSAASLGFSDFKGKAEEKDQWRSNVSLDVDDCLIRLTENGGMTFSCQSQRYATKKEAEEIALRRSRAALQCLGDRWSILSAETGAIAINDKQSDIVSFVVRQTPSFDTSGKVTQQYQVHTLIWNHAAAQSQGTHETDASKAAESKSTPTPIEVPTNFCPDLKKAIAAASKNLDPVLGKRHGDYWMTRSALTGFDDCSISEIENNGKTMRYQTCSLPPTSDKTELQTIAKKLDETINSCLGADWTRDDSSRRRGCPRITYEAGNADPTVELRTSHCGRGTEWSINVDVNTPTP
jgi:hypothetical protein